MPSSLSLKPVALSITVKWYLLIQLASSVTGHTRSIPTSPANEVPSKYTTESLSLGLVYSNVLDESI